MIDCIYDPQTGNCIACERPPARPNVLKRNCKLLWKKTRLPGDEMFALLKSLKLRMKQGCGCKAKKREMNQWGLEGCRENRETIRGWLVEGSKGYDWAEKLLAAGIAVFKGIAFRISLSDPYGSIVDEALRRCELKPGV